MASASAAAAWRGEKSHQRVAAANSIGRINLSISENQSGGMASEESGISGIW